MAHVFKEDEDKEKENIYLDCWPSGRFCVGIMVPPDEHATIILASLLILDSTPDKYTISVYNISVNLGRHYAYINNM